MRIARRLRLGSARRILSFAQAAFGSPGAVLLASLLASAPPVIALAAPPATGAVATPAPGAPVATPAAKPEVVVAFRVDAPPFVAVDQSGSPTGFLWEVCERAVGHAGYQPKPVPIDAAQRTQLLLHGNFMRKDGVTVTPDLLCDPTTITIARMTNFDDVTGDAPNLSFSPIVFIANGAYLQQKGVAAPAIGRMGKDDKDTAALCARLETESRQESKPNKWYQPVLLPRDPATPEDTGGTPYVVWGYVAGSTIEASIRQAIDRVGDNQIVCERKFASHREAADAFCAGQIFRYFGDVEVIREALDEHFRRTGRKCDVDASGADGGTYEPYALVLSSTCRREFPERFTRGLYTLFQEGTIDQIFAESFKGAEATPYLSTLFRINSIPLGSEPDPSRKPRPEDVVRRGCSALP